jgi:hypothetical protein
MKLFHFILATTLLSCTEPAHDKSMDADNDTIRKPGTLPAETPDTPQATKPSAAPDSSRPKTYANQRFRAVTVQKIGEDKYTVKGEGQIFEASFSWVVEDGHNELLSGHQMTDAGAPEWGKFSFTIEAKKARPNSTLTLILFEASAKDGSRQHQLPIVLE